MNGKLRKWSFYLLIFCVPHFLLNLGQPKLLYMINLVGIYAILAIAINLLVGYTGQISLGHAAFMAIGAYTSGICTLKLHLPVPLAMIMAGGVSGLFGYLLGLPALRMKGHYLAILTLAFGFIVPGVIARFGSITGGFTGLHPPKFYLFNFLFDYLGKGAVTDGSSFYVIVIILWAGYLFSFNLLTSRTGRAFIALQAHESAARSIGIHVTKYKTLAFFYSTLFAGLAGALYAHLVGYIEPKGFDLWMSFMPLIMCVVGGLGSVTGSVVGSFFILLFPELVKEFTRIPDIPNLILALFLILILIFLPNGLISIRHFRFSQFKKLLFPNSRKKGEPIA